MPRIYILGAVGSGKSTLARKLSSEMSVPFYELDNVVWKKNEEGPDSRRSEDEIASIFDDIISQDNWIIENVGRSFFDKGFDYADTILYLNLKKETLYWRVLKRWAKQNIGFENVPYKADLNMLRQMFKWVDKELNDSKLNKLTQYLDKTTILTEGTIKQYKYKK